MRNDDESNALSHYLLAAPGKLIPESAKKGRNCGQYLISFPKLLKVDNVENKDIRKNTRLGCVLIPLTSEFNPQKYFWAKSKSIGY